MSQEPVNIYVRLTDDGRHIRKWGFKPFEGAAAYVQTGMPVMELTVSERRIRNLEQALIRCRDQFFFYAEQHLSKETKEGNEKAATNRELEAMCDEVLGANRCEAPGCRNPTENGICDACDRWVDQQVVIGEIVGDIAELGDRESPADQPDMMLVTAEELQSILEGRLPALSIQHPATVTTEEHRLEDLKQMASYAGPIVSFDVRDPYYLASCDHCGWVGSSELCRSDEADDVFCPRCQTGGADCGKIAERLGSRPDARATEREVQILRRALAWHGDMQRMATTREEWQQTIDAAICWVKEHPEDGYPSFPGITLLATHADGMPG